MAGEPVATITQEEYEQSTIVAAADAERLARQAEIEEAQTERLFSGDAVGGVFGALNYNTIFASLNYPGEWARLTTGPMVIPRIPVMLTTEEMASQNRYLVFWSNPDSVQWNLRMRGTVQETRGGLIQHYHKDAKRNTFFDEPEMNITFQTGNIMPIRVTAEAPNGNTRFGDLGVNNTITYMPHGLLNLYEFIELLDQKKVMADGRTNYVYMLYSSLVFPKIVLRGFFPPDAAMSFQEAAMENAEVKWSTTFRVVGSYPKFNSANSLARTWRSVQEFQGYDVSYAGSAFTSIPEDRQAAGTQ